MKRVLRTKPEAAKQPTPGKWAEFERASEIAERRLIGKIALSRAGIKKIPKWEQLMGSIQKFEASRKTAASRYSRGKLKARSLADAYAKERTKFERDVCSVLGTEKGKKFLRRFDKIKKEMEKIKWEIHKSEINGFIKATGRNPYPEAKKRNNNPNKPPKR